MSQETYNRQYREVSDVVECVVDKHELASKFNFADIVISLMLTMKLIDTKNKKIDEKKREKFKECSLIEGVEMDTLIVHDDLVKAINLNFLKHNIIPFLVRVGLNRVKSQTMFDTVIQFFKKIYAGSSDIFNNFQKLMEMNRNDYLSFLENVSKGGKVLTGATTSKFVATSTADESDLRLFIDDWTVKEKSDLGVYLINNGNKMRLQKGTFEINIDSESGGEKKVLVKFPRESEEITRLDFTYPRAAIVTARDVAQTCCQISDGGIKMSALALNIGWHGLFLQNNIEKLSNVFKANECQVVTEEKLYLRTIPRIRPHASLNMDSTEKYLMVIFYIIISLKSGKDRFDFTSDTRIPIKKY